MNDLTKPLNKSQKWMLLHFIIKWNQRFAGDDYLLAEEVLCLFGEDPENERDEYIEIPPEDLNTLIDRVDVETVGRYVLTSWVAEYFGLLGE